MTRGPVALEMAANINMKKLEFINVFARIVLEKNLIPEGNKYSCFNYKALQNIVISVLFNKYAGLLPYD